MPTISLNWLRHGRDEIAASMRGYVAWFASLFSAVLALTKLAFIADWRRTAYDERLLHGLEAADARQLKGTRIPSILFIVMTTLQLVNATLLWYRNDRIYIRCAGLIALDAVIVALAGICFHLSVPFLFEGRKGNQGADSYKAGVVPPPEGHIIRHPELRNSAGAVFGMSLGGLGLHVIAVLLWVKFIPSHARLSNVHRPVSISRNGTTGRGVKGFFRQRGRNPSSLELVQPIQRDSSALERLFQDHEKTWRAGRMARSGHKGITVMSSSTEPDHIENVQAASTSRTLSSTGLRFHPAVRYWAFGRGDVYKLQRYVWSALIFYIALGLLESVCVHLSIKHDGPYPVQSQLVYGHIWVLVILLCIIIILPRYRSFLDNRLWGAHRLRAFLGWLLFTYQFIGIVSHVCRTVWSFIYEANETFEWEVAAGASQRGIQVVTDFFGAFVGLLTCWKLVQVWRSKEPKFSRLDSQL